MNLCNESCSYVRLSVVLSGKNFCVGHYTQTVQPIFVTPAMLIGTIDFCHAILLSLTLTLPGGHKVSANKTSWLHFLAQFPFDQDEV